MMNNNNKLFTDTLRKPQMTDNMLFAHEQDVPPRLMFVSRYSQKNKNKKLSSGFACLVY